MIKELWRQIKGYSDSHPESTLQEISEKTGAPISTVSYQKQRMEKRKASSGTDNWETGWGQNFLKRMIISVIYTFGIKGGVGAARISEHLGHLQIEGIAAVSESSIYRLTFAWQPKVPKWVSERITTSTLRFIFLNFSFTKVVFFCKLNMKLELGIYYRLKRMGSFFNISFINTITQNGGSSLI